jgi:hypothetical protein
MRHLVAILALSALMPPAIAATAPATSVPAKPVCLNPNKDYDADYLSGRAVLLAATEGKRPRAKLKADTNCIGLDARARIRVDAKGDCVAAGDMLKLRRPGDSGMQTCQITQITDMAPAR